MLNVTLYVHVYVCMVICEMSIYNVIDYNICFMYRDMSVSDCKRVQRLAPLYKRKGMLSMLKTKYKAILLHG